MKLTYRGVSYETPEVPTVDATPLGLSGKYRGLDYRFRRSQPAYVIPPHVTLTYRGVAFNPTRPEDVQATVQPVQPTVSVQDLARNRLLRQTQVIKKRQQSLLVRLAEEIGLSGEQVSHYAGRIQGKVAANARESYARLGVAMS
ncbi:DUF4278 domain-containing protein [Synechocystis sp. LKSZ1]|uniref:DUF4278 domain-containing protein n=1 Tax=Synechocystis sp. LKSZ1 TaxID=3144951 RepID=UPI00336C07BD